MVQLEVWQVLAVVEGKEMEVLHILGVQVLLAEMLYMLIAQRL
jgi:hypothetical protein